MRVELASHQDDLHPSRRRGTRSRRRPPRSGVVARAHERTALHVGEAEAAGEVAELVELSGVHHRTTGRCAVDGRRYWPSGDDVDADAAQVRERAVHLVGRSRPCPG